MKGIDDGGKKITDIISVIDGVALQTNICASSHGAGTYRANVEAP